MVNAAHRMPPGAGWQLVRYVITGGLNTAVSFVVYSILVLLHISSPLALSIGYVAGMITSYSLNAIWTFQKNARSVEQGLRFLVVNGVMLGLSEIGLWWFRHNVTHDSILAQLFNLVPITILGFLANRWIVFADHEIADRDAAKTAIKSSARTTWLAAVGFVVIQHAIALVAAWKTLQKLHRPVTGYMLLVKGFEHWDSSWYLSIAQHGYSTYKSTAFWPVYPYLIGWFHSLTGLDSPTCGIVISLIAFVVAVYFLGRLTKMLFSAEVSYVAMALFAFAPMSFYFNSIYTEALFLALCLGGVYAAFTSRFLVASMVIAVATVTRNTGVLLLVVMFFAYLHERGNGLKFWRLAWWKQLNYQLAYFLIPPLSLGGYCLWMKQKFGNPLAFLMSEKYWHRTYMSPWNTYRHTWFLFFHPSVTKLYHNYLAFELFSFTTAVLFLVVGLFYARKSLQLFGLWLYMLAVFWISSTEPSMNLPDYLVSFPRYLLMMFPGFIFLAAFLRNKWLGSLVAVVFAVFLFNKTGLFVRGTWIA